MSHESEQIVLVAQASSGDVVGWIHVFVARRILAEPFADELSAFDVVNIGAAGTFVVRKTINRKDLRAELLRRLPFKAELMICRARDLMHLASADPFPREAYVKGVRRFVSVLAKRPSTMPRFPFNHPEGKAWQVKVVGLRGRFALSLWRRMGRSLVYPNEVLEKELSIPATTRNWDTISKIANILHATRVDSGS